MTEHVTDFFADPAQPAAPSAHDAPAVPGLSPHETALIAEACSKSGVVWLRPPGEKRYHPAWHTWHQDAVHVVFGVDEQMLPLMLGEVEVVARSKETSARLVTFVAVAELLEARTPEWEAAAEALSTKRLNALEPEGQRERWASGTLLTRLTPVRMVEALSGDDQTASGSAPPTVNPATTLGRQPYHLRGRTRRRPHLFG